MALLERDKSIVGASSESSPENDGQRTAIDIIEAGINTSRERGFAALKVNHPELGWIELGEFLSGRYFHALKMTSEARGAIFNKYTQQSREYDKPKPVEEFAVPLSEMAPHAIPRFDKAISDGTAVYKPSEKPYQRAKDGASAAAHDYDD